MKLRPIALTLALSMMSVTGAQAAVVAGSDVCGELPNVKWSWLTEQQTVTSGGEVSSNSYDQTRVAGNNTFLDTYTTTTVAPTFTTINTICTALNPQGKVNLDHSVTIMGEPVQTDAGSSTTDKTALKVCGPNLTPC
ncbi:MAG: hypothetical protein FJX25_16450 [Alphaproteobacteria bacterium]|nr:hypothetical protein [Alphaproteobacteria bacterium]